mmetsp:Transcript_46190/g.68817  ORF Transcript_46190/g.68817 Transcript_46190/m.68817 type:complete len:188 (-) Transcript_46190:406-969(-)
MSTPSTASRGLGGIHRSLFNRCREWMQELSKVDIQSNEHLFSTILIYINAAPLLAMCLAIAPHLAQHPSHLFRPLIIYASLASRGMVGLFSEGLKPPRNVSYRTTPSFLLSIHLRRLVLEEFPFSLASMLLQKASNGSCKNAAARAGKLSHLPHELCEDHGNIVMIYYQSVVIVQHTLGQLSKHPFS